MAEINISNLGSGGGGTLTLTTTGTGGASTYVAGVLNIPVYQTALTNPVTGTGTATRVAFWDSASSVSSSANLYWDNSNSFLGVGTATPGARLQVNGTGLLTATAFAVKDSGGTDSFTVADNGNTSVRGVLTISGSSASNSATLMGRTSTGEVTSVTLGTNLSFSGNTLNATGGTGITSLNGLTAATQTFATGTAGTDFNISSATSTHTFNLPTASATNRGALSSADWTTFNNKQNALTNPVTGTGANGRVTFWNGTNSVSSNSSFFWDNSSARLGVGTSTPATVLNIASSSNALGYGDGAQVLWADDIPSNRPVVGFYRARGSVSSPQNILADDVLGSFSFFGRTSGTYIPYGTIRQVAKSGGTSQMETYLRDGTTETIRNVLFPSGNMAIQSGGAISDNNYRLQISASGATAGAVQIRGAGTTGLTTLLIQNNTPSTLFQILDSGATTLNGTLAQNGTVTMSDGSNIVVGSTNGTKIGTATTQKIGFYNATPIVRPDIGVAASAFVAGTGTAVNDNSTFGGYTIKQVVQALQNLGLLA